MIKKFKLFLREKNKYINKNNQQINFIYQQNRIS